MSSKLAAAARDQANWPQTQARRRRLIFGDRGSAGRMEGRDLKLLFYFVSPRSLAAGWLDATPAAQTQWSCRQSVGRSVGRAAGSGCRLAVAAPGRAWTGARRSRRKAAQRPREEASGPALAAERRLFKSCSSRATVCL